MQVSHTNDVKVYNLSGGKSLPQWLTHKEQRERVKNDTELEHKVELISDFELHEVATKVKLTPDGQYLYAYGIYPPLIKCYDLKQMTLKFDRGADGDVLNFVSLSEDYGKVVLLFDDRYLEIHSQNGKYYRMRVPSIGRDLSYNWKNCDLYVVGSSQDIYRLNMEQGRFLASFTSTHSSSFNASVVNRYHQLLAVGSQEGSVECWDPRVRKCVGCIKATSFLDSADSSVAGVSKLKFHESMTLSVGTTTGQVMLFDVRATKPTLIKDHNYGFPILAMDFSSNFDTDYVISSDKKGVKTWNRHSGKLLTAIEPDHDINDFCLYPQSGLIFVAKETKQIGSYFIPELGPAPRWCSFLENITEELEEDYETVIYDDYRFVTREQLNALGLAGLIGSKVLRAYMHGFFIDASLYNEAKAASEPFAYETFKQKKIEQDIKKERHDRVISKVQLPDVNREVAIRLNNQKMFGRRKAKADADAVLSDDRFDSLFKNPDMEMNIDDEDLEYINPSVLWKMSRLQPELAQIAEQMAEDEQEMGQFSDEERHNSDSELSSDDSGEFRRVRKKIKKKERNQQQTIASYYGFDKAKTGHDESTSENYPEKNTPLPEVFVANSENDNFIISSRLSEESTALKKESLMERLAKEDKFSRQAGVVASEQSAVVDTSGKNEPKLAKRKSRKSK